MIAFCVAITAEGDERAIGRRIQRIRKNVRWRRYDETAFVLEDCRFTGLGKTLSCVQR